MIVSPTGTLRCTSPSCANCRHVWLSACLLSPSMFIAYAAVLDLLPTHSRQHLPRHCGWREGECAQSKTFQQGSHLWQGRYGIVIDQEFFTKVTRQGFHYTNILAADCSLLGEHSLKKAVSPVMQPSQTSSLSGGLLLVNRQGRANCHLRVGLAQRLKFHVRA